MPSRLSCIYEDAAPRPVYHRNCRCQRAGRLRCQLRPCDERHVSMLRARLRNSRRIRSLAGSERYHDCCCRLVEVVAVIEIPRFHHAFLSRGQRPAWCFHAVGFWKAASMPPITAGIGWRLQWINGREEVVCRSYAVADYRQTVAKLMATKNHAAKRDPRRFPGAPDARSSTRTFHQEHGMGLRSRYSSQSSGIPAMRRRSLTPISSVSAIGS